MKKIIITVMCLLGEALTASVPSVYVSYSGTCLGDQIVFVATQDAIVQGASYHWYVDDEPVYSSDNNQFTYTFSEPGTYFVSVTVDSESNSGISVGESITITECFRCLEEFKLLPSKKYLLSAWVYSEAGNSDGYSIQIASDNQNIAEFVPKGSKIDGWQKIEGAFSTSASLSSLSVFLSNTTGADVYFDDLRIQAFDASMKTYVYDAKSLKLKAELDENNYATFYDYDQQGDLIRIKKETERGVKTLSEFRQNMKMQP